MNKNLRIILVFITVFLTITIVYLFVKKQPNKNVNNQTVPQLSIEKLYKDKYSIEIGFNQNQYDFPKEMPFISKNDTAKLFQKSDYSLIGKKAGFNEEPIIAQDVNKGTTYIWNNSNYSLTIYSIENKFDYTSSTPIETLVQQSTNKSPSEESYISLAKNFLFKKMNYSEDGLNFSGFTYLKIKKNSEVFINSSKSDYDIIQVNFSPKITSYPIITQNPQENFISVQVTKNESISKVIGYFNVAFQATENKSVLKNFDQFKNSINDSILISLDGNNVLLNELQRNIVQKIIINNISLAYLINSYQDSYFQPIFVLSGDAYLTNSSSSVKAILYLQAFAN